MTTYDNSQLQTFKDCPERYRLKYVEQLRKRDSAQEEHDREYGSAIHKGLEVIYNRGTLKEAQDAFAKMYPLQLNEEDKAKTLENGLTLLADYVEHYKAEDTQFEVLQNEKKDEFELAPGVPFIVKVDLVVKKQGCIYALDHKTTKKSFGWDYWGQYDPNPQITAQTAYVQARFGECSGVIINALSFGFRTRAYKGEPAGFHCSFQRQLFNRNKQQVDAWKKDQLKWIKKFDIERALEAEASDGGVWTKNEGQCRFCSYKESCISCNDEQIKEQLFEAHDATGYLKGE